MCMRPLVIQISFLIEVPLFSPLEAWEVVANVVLWVEDKLKMQLNTKITTFVRYDLSADLLSYILGGPYG